MKILQTRVLSFKQDTLFWYLKTLKKIINGNLMKGQVHLRAPVRSEKMKIRIKHNFLSRIIY